VIKTKFNLIKFLENPELLITSEGFNYTPFSIYKEELLTEGFIFPVNKMIGKQAESCFQYYLENSKIYNLLVANLQIQGVKATIGEIDYIVFNTKTKQTIHVELACKFYLYDEKIDNLQEANWIGPNRKDTLLEKKNKLKEKQFPLLHTSETNGLLEQLQIDTKNIKQQYCLKVFLFIPKEFQKEKLAVEFQKCIIGYWIKINEFIYNKYSTYAIPTKKEWLLSPQSIQNWISFEEAKLKIIESLENKKAPLVYSITKGAIDRFFVVWW
jgi:hypothetical protein